MVKHLGRGSWPWQEETLRVARPHLKSKMSTGQAGGWTEVAAVERSKKPMWQRTRKPFLTLNFNPVVKPSLWGSAGNLQVCVDDCGAGQGPWVASGGCAPRRNKALGRAASSQPRTPGSSGFPDQLQLILQGSAQAVT